MIFCAKKLFTKQKGNVEMNEIDCMKSKMMMIGIAQDRIAL